MSANASCHKLIKASTEASQKGVQHILAIMKPDGTYAMSGSDNMVHAILNNPTLYTALRDTITANTLQEGIIFPLNVINYPLLPCAPGSKGWKGSARIRKVLDSMVTSAGYGKYGKKLGQGLAPIGWPDDIPWAGYKGAANSGLTIPGMTMIIVSLLEAAQLDPATHVMADDPPQDLENNENIENDAIEEVVNDDGDNIENDDIEAVLNEDGVGNDDDNIEQEVAVDIVEYHHEVPLVATDDAGVKDDAAEKDGEPEMADKVLDLNFNDRDEESVKGRDDHVGDDFDEPKEPTEQKKDFGKIASFSEFEDEVNIGKEQSKEKCDTSAKKKRYI